MFIDLVLEILMHEEGYREECYLCSEGYVTVGIGTRVYDKPVDTARGFCIQVSREAAEELARRDIERAISIIESNESKKRIFRGLDDNRKAVLVSMAYQMGYGVLKFENMWSAHRVSDWETAQLEALDSLWARQTRGRALRHSEVLLTGEATEY